MTPRILVVEDEEHLAVALKLNFTAEGWDCAVCGDGPAALREFRQARAEERPFDLIVLDLMLPKMSGYEVAQTVRSEDAGTPILVLSAKSMTEDRIQAFERGVDQFLHKPFALAELLARVRNLLARRQTGTRPSATPTPTAVGHVVEFAGSTVNFRTHEVLVRGTPTKLSPLHLQLLRLFVENEGSVLSREEILEKVWEHSIIPSTTRVVDNAVMLLRKTFEADQAAPRHFHSVRGAGYRFVLKPTE